MKNLVLPLLFALLSPVWAWGQLQSKRVRVLFPRPDLQGYAREVDKAAEAALDVLDPLFGERRQKVVLRLNDSQDNFNAFTSTIPRPTVELLSPFPNSAEIDVRSSSVTYLLLVHELTHARQLTFTEKPGKKKPALRLGLIGENSSHLPPAWFTEGIATYMESRFTSGGRLDWAYTQGLINALALRKTGFPDLADMSLYTFNSWPRWRTRYLLGVRFVSYLIARHGWSAILDTLRQYNGGAVLPPSFAEAWRRANGGSLVDEWRTWSGQELRRAESYRSYSLDYLLRDENGSRPAVDPSNKLLAYFSRGCLGVEPLAGGGFRCLARVRPQRLWWRDDSTLLYSRFIREGDGVGSDIFALDVASGVEKRLSHGLHALLATPAADGCVLFVRDRAGEASSLMKFCNGAVTRLWRAGGGEHLLGLAVSPAGKVALSLWRSGRVDLALLEGGGLKFLTKGWLDVARLVEGALPCSGASLKLGPCSPRNGYQHLDPTWLNDEKLLFRADEPGTFQYFVLDTASGKVYSASNSFSGFAGAATPAGGHLIAPEIGPAGVRLVDMPQPWEEQPVSLVFLDSPRWKAADTVAKSAPYNPWESLKPYGWMPTAVYPSRRAPYLGLEASVFGLDDSGEYGYRAVLGYAPDLRGPVLGGYAYLLAGWRAGVDLQGKRAPLGFTVKTGLWPSGVGSIETGALAGLVSGGAYDRWRWRASLEAGPVWDEAGGLQLEVNGSARGGVEARDQWGYLKNGFYLEAAGRWRNVGRFAQAGAGYALGLRDWPLFLQFKVAGGCCLPLKAGMRPNPLSGVLQARLRYSLETKWRSEDGWLALERFTIAPGARLWYDGGPGYGAELGLYADTVLFYALPLPVGLRFGWANGWWGRLELGSW